jgi:hypothetical protein
VTHHEGQGQCLGQQVARQWDVAFARMRAGQASVCEVLAAPSIPLPLQQLVAAHPSSTASVVMDTHAGTMGAGAGAGAGQGRGVNQEATRACLTACPTLEEIYAAMRAFYCFE